MTWIKVEDSLPPPTTPLPYGGESSDNVIVIRYIGKNSIEYSIESLYYPWKGGWIPKFSDDVKYWSYIPNEWKNINIDKPPYEYEEHGTFMSELLLVKETNDDYDDMVEIDTYMVPSGVYEHQHNLKKPEPYLSKYKDYQYWQFIPELPDDME